MKFFTLVALIVLLNYPVTGQKNTNVERAKTLKSALKDQTPKVVAFRNSSAYTFQPNGASLSVLHESEIDLISLEGNLKYAKHVFYNDNIKVENNAVRFTSGKSIDADVSCGNYEVENVFYSDAKVCSYNFNFLSLGTEISFRSRTRYTDPRYFTRIFFHDVEPAAERQITVTVPEGVTVELVEKNFDGYDIKKTVTKNNGHTIYTYRALELAMQKSESNSLGIFHYYPHIIVLTKKFKTPAGETAVISNVEDLYKWYSGLTNQVKSDPSSFKDVVQNLISLAKTPEDKVKKIYYWVQDNIKYIAFEDGLAGFQPAPAEDVFTNRFGDCKGMANLTKEMLKVAGFDARLTWIGTNRLPYNYDIPSLCVDNHMICTVMLGADLYILDSTEKYIALGKNAERIQGKEMLIENGKSFIREKVPVADFNANLISRNEILTLDGFILNGEGQLSMNGEAKKEILYLSTNVKQEDQKKVFDNLVVSKYSNTDKVRVTNTPPIDREKPLEVKYSFTLANKVALFDQDLYVGIDWNQPFREMKIEDTRESDYYFHRKVHLITVKKLTVPAGYKISHLPEGLSKKHDDFSFEVSFRQVGSELIYTNEIIVSHGIIRKNNFPEWNSYIKALNEVYDDQLVLTRSK
ncbi:MAG: transglutaminase domain-containing protein [Chryseolinea sp.]